MPELKRDSAEQAAEEPPQKLDSPEKKAESSPDGDMSLGDCGSSASKPAALKKREEEHSGCPLAEVELHGPAAGEVVNGAIIQESAGSSSSAAAVPAVDEVEVQQPVVNEDELDQAKIGGAVDEDVTGEAAGAASSNEPQFVPNDPVGITTTAQEQETGNNSTVMTPMFGSAAPVGHTPGDTESFVAYKETSKASEVVQAGKEESERKAEESCPKNEVEIEDDSVMMGEAEGAAAAAGASGVEEDEMADLHVIHAVDESAPAEAPASGAAELEAEEALPSGAEGETKQDEVDDNNAMEVEEEGLSKAAESVAVPADAVAAEVEAAFSEDISIIKEEEDELPGQESEPAVAEIVAPAKEPEKLAPATSNKPAGLAKSSSSAAGSSRTPRRAEGPPASSMATGAGVKPVQLLGAATKKRPAAAEVEPRSAKRVKTAPGTGLTPARRAERLAAEQARTSKFQEQLSTKQEKAEEMQKKKEDAKAAREKIKEIADRIHSNLSTKLVKKKGEYVVPGGSVQFQAELKVLQTMCPPPQAEQQTGITWTTTVVNEDHPDHHADQAGVLPNFRYREDAGRFAEREGGSGEDAAGAQAEIEPVRHVRNRGGAVEDEELDDDQRLLRQF
ncbi:unnamed protein product [Amoebophrya sp. A120]|nr:unnamed protein product [Amoebophrya sp. A120]|eukprot:GSA120T00006039001.1